MRPKPAVLESLAMGTINDGYWSPPMYDDTDNLVAGGSDLRDTRHDRAKRIPDSGTDPFPTRTCAATPPSWTATPSSPAGIMVSSRHPTAITDES
jgi:hypothetical protein